MQTLMKSQAVRTACAVFTFVVTLSMATDASAYRVRTEATVLGGDGGSAYYGDDQYFNGIDTPTVFQGTAAAILPSTPDGAALLASQSGVRSTNGNGSYATAHANVVTGIGGATAISAPAHPANAFAEYNAAFGSFDLQDTFTVHFSGGGTRVLGLTVTIDGSYSESSGGEQPRTSLVGIAGFGAGSFQYEIVGKNINPLANPLLAYLTPGQTFGWLDSTTDFTNPLAITLSAHIQVSDGQTLPFRSYLSIDCRNGSQCDFGSTITPSILLPDGVTLTSEATGNAVAFAGYAAPVPEPQTYALMLVGLATVGWARRRNSQRG